MSPLLLRKRHCCCCSSEAPPGQVSGSSPMISLNFTIYRKSPRSRQHLAARRISVCENCLLAAMAGERIKAGVVSAAIFESIADRYNASIVGEKA